MTDYTRISIVRPVSRPAALTVVLTDGDLALGSRASGFGVGDVVAAAAKAAGFKGKRRAVLDILAPAADGIDRLVVVGLGDASSLGEGDWLAIGGEVRGALGRPR